MFICFIIYPLQHIFLSYLFIHIKSKRVISLLWSSPIFSLSKYLRHKNNGQGKKVGILISSTLPLRLQIRAKWKKIQRLQIRAKCKKIKDTILEKKLPSLKIFLYSVEQLLTMYPNKFYWLMYSIQHLNVLSYFNPLSSLIDQ